MYWACELDMSRVIEMSILLYIESLGDPARDGFSNASHYGFAFGLLGSEVEYCQPWVGRQRVHVIIDADVSLISC